MFLKIFSVISTNLNYKKWQLFYSILLMASCVYNFYIAPKIVCAIEEKCDNTLSTVIKTLFVRVVASVSFISRLVIILKGNGHFVQYKKTMENIHKITPMTRSESKRLRNVSFTFLIFCLILTIPVNILRLSTLILRFDFTVQVFFFMYLQNFTMYCIETHFNILCFIIHQKFVGINRDLMALKIDAVVRNKYPFKLQMEEIYGDDNHNRDVLHSLADGHPMANMIERLKIKHRSVREAMGNLNDLFGIHLGLSMCSLCLYAMFDLYYNIMQIMKPKSNLLIYGWILQYTIRFGSVIILSHLTTKQALKSKILITDINNRYLDNNTKEELKLFLNQICSCTIEYTANGFFTLNNHLITSALAAGTTYLVILLQLNSEK